MSKEVTSSSDLKAPDFTEQWEMSDVLIRTNNGRVLHVNKALLAIHSPFFKGLFFSDFVESSKSEVTVDVDFELMLEILNILHQVDRRFVPEGHKEYPIPQLADLYNAADKFDIPLIRELCRQQVVANGTKEAFEIAVELGLQKEKSKILEKLNLETAIDYVEYFNTRDAGAIFSSRDVITILKKTGIFRDIECARCSSVPVLFIDDSFYCHKCRCRWI